MTKLIFLIIFIFLAVLGIIFKVIITWQMKYIFDLERKIREKEDKIAEQDAIINSVQFQLKLEENESKF